MDNIDIAIYSIILNHHQAPIADALWEETGHRFVFVELEDLNETKGGNMDYSHRPYLLRAWESKEKYNDAMNLARNAPCCIFSGLSALPFQKERLKLGLLSFDMSERWLKQGLLNLFSPTIFKMFCSYYLYGWKHKPLYKLCCSAFAATDHYKLGMYRGKCFRWGYFTRVEKFDVKAARDVSTSNADGTPLMWCARYLTWKHPELPLIVAARLKKDGYRFTLDMYGNGEYELAARKLAESLGITDVAHFIGIKPNNELMHDMRHHDIFLFTSDRNEGWGAVANESLANGCVLVASDAIGSSPYLIKNRVTGFMFKSPDTSSSINNPDAAAINSLYGKVKWLLDNPIEMRKMQRQAVQRMQSLYSPAVAAKRLLALIEHLKNNSKPTFPNGPCSLDIPN